MSMYVILKASELGTLLILAPERFDPRRNVKPSAGRLLSDLADVITETVSATSLKANRPVLVLDTAHAYEGFVILRHAPVMPPELGSAKRSIKPGDVIISRLRPYLRQVAYVDEKLFNLLPGGNEVVASTEFFVIRGKQGFDTPSLVPLLLSDPVQKVLSAGQEGGHHPRFSRELLNSLRVPNYVEKQTKRLADDVKNLAGGIRNSLAGCRDLISLVEGEMQDELDPS